MIQILSIPPLATVQDLGRDGFCYQGLGRAGVMDDIAHRVANMLLGNAANMATLEIPLSPARLEVTSDGALSVVGAKCGARLDGQALPRVWAGPVRKGQILELGPISAGAQIYLALPGGIDVPKVLGSRSTQLREGFGGFDGRVLAPGDILRAAGTVQRSFPNGGISATLPDLHDPDGIITVRALPSSEHDSFTEAARKEFWSSPYEVTPQCNRQGYRLEGPPLERTQNGEMRSHGIGPGIVQVPGGGQPIIQLADSATMGGYPKIAAVIEPDLWRIGQARPGDRLRFVPVTLMDAAKAATDHAEWISGLEADLNRTHALIQSWV